jgi:hypothetical protein
MTDGGAVPAGQCRQPPACLALRPTLASMSCDLGVPSLWAPRNVGAHVRRRSRRWLGAHAWSSGAQARLAGPRARPSPPLGTAGRSSTLPRHTRYERGARPAPAASQSICAPGGQRDGPGRGAACVCTGQQGARRSSCGRSTGGRGSIAGAGTAPGAGGSAGAGTRSGVGTVTGLARQTGCRPPAAGEDPPHGTAAALPSEAGRGEPTQPGGPRSRSGAQEPAGDAAAVCCAAARRCAAATLQRGWARAPSRSLGRSQRSTLHHTPHQRPNRRNGW